jgi:multidrug efflux system membrane fusion protein
MADCIGIYIPKPNFHTHGWPRIAGRVHDVGLSRLCLFLAIILGVAACKPAPAPAPMPPAEVTVAQPLKREVIEWDEYTGRLRAIEDVEIRSRVSGYLESIHFTDGAIVEKGDLLFVIDPRPFEAVLKAAQAELARAQARLDLAKNDLKRAETLLADKAISAEDYDTRSKTVQQSTAELESARATIESAELDVEFTHIRAPIRGRTSRHFVTEGNLISGGSSNSTLLTTIVSLDPIHCYFDVSERAMLKYTRLSLAGVRASSRNAANPVFISLADEEGFIHEGMMDFVDNKIDPNTGTLRGRAVFPNPEDLLLPGLFVRLRLIGSGRYDAVQIPDSAIATDQSRKYVYVVDASNVVSMREIKPGRIIDGLRVIDDGLTPDDVIVVAGLQRARPGEAVVPVRTEIRPTRIDTPQELLERLPTVDAFMSETAPTEPK